MDLNLAKKMAIELMTEHRVPTNWVFRFDRGRRRFGCCNYTKTTISLSHHLVRLNSEERVKNTILHEIAHALCPGAHHGPAWVRTAKSIGCTGERCYTAENTVTMKPLIKGTCPTPDCGAVLLRNRVSRKACACSACCRRFNHGAYDAKYTLIWSRNV